MPLERQVDVVGLLAVISSVAMTGCFAGDPVTEIAEDAGKLYEKLFATPGVCSSRIYIRTAEGTGADRRERLYCIGNAAGKG